MLSLRLFGRAARRGTCLAAGLILCLLFAADPAHAARLTITLKSANPENLRGLAVRTRHAGTRLVSMVPGTFNRFGQSTVPYIDTGNAGTIVTITGVTALGEHVYLVRYVPPGARPSIEVDDSELIRLPRGYGAPSPDPSDNIRDLQRKLRAAEAAGRTEEASVYRGMLLRMREMLLGTLTAMKNNRRARPHLHRDAVGQLEGAIAACDAALAPATQVRDDILGTWRMTPIAIKNPALCGNVTYHADIVVERKVSDTFYLGSSPFRWDLSRADPACRFKFHRTGTARVEIFRKGDAITIKYYYRGPNTYADDTLILNGRVMSGRDGSGETITFTKLD